MDKKIVCKLDGRRFATQAGLAQHRRDSHQANKTSKMAPQPTRGASRRKRNRGGSGAASGIPAAVSQRVMGDSGSDVAILSGVDRLAHIENVRSFKTGGIVFDFLVVPGGFKRLAKVAAAFQYIEYQQLIFEVEPQIPVVTSGGYVAGFIGDPEDDLTDLNQLTSTRGSITTKWWQNARVPANFVRRKYYTRPGPELREFSPGRFGIMVDGASNQGGPLTIFCRWKVRLSGAILEPPPAKQFTFKQSIWIRNGHQGVWAKTGTGTADTDFTSEAAKMLDCKAGDYFKLSAPIGLVKPNDNVYALHHWLYVKDAKSVFLSCNFPTDWYEAAYTVDNLVIDAGDVASKAASPDKAGEETLGSSSGSETEIPQSGILPGSLEKLSTTLELLLRLQTLPEQRLEKLLNSFSRSRMNSSASASSLEELQVPSPLGEKP